LRRGMHVWRAFDYEDDNPLRTGAYSPSAFAAAARTCGTRNGLVR